MYLPVGAVPSLCARLSLVLALISFLSSFSRAPRAKVALAESFDSLFFFFYIYVRRVINGAPEFCESFYFNAVYFKWSLFAKREQLSLLISACINIQCLI